MFDLIVIITAHSPADVAPVADALARMRPMWLAEPGCISWEGFHSEDNPLRFVLVEQWASKADWEAHGALAAIQTIYLPEILPRISREIHPSQRIG